MSGGRGNQLASKSAINKRANQPNGLSLQDRIQLYNLFIISQKCYRRAKVQHLLETFNNATTNDQIFAIKDYWLALGWCISWVGRCDDKSILQFTYANWM